MNSVFWPMQQLNGHLKDCSLNGVRLDCRMTNEITDELLATADALLYHTPHMHGKPRARLFPTQLRIAITHESAAYYGNINDPQFMCGFDAEASYRTCSQAPYNYMWFFNDVRRLLFETPVPFEEKEHALVYLNSNCGTMSPRAALMRSLMALGDKAKMPVHSFGRCDPNREVLADHSLTKRLELQRRYKFCVAMENSVSYDYVTEKVWYALAAGCVPVYLGSPTVWQVVPDPRGVVVYDPGGKGNASTPEELDVLLGEIGGDKPRYEAMLAWRKAPVEQLSPAFRAQLVSYNGTSDHLGECTLCQFLARHRVDPQPRYTTCLFNETWTKAAGMQVADAGACAAE